MAYEMNAAQFLAWKDRLEKTEDMHNTALELLNEVFAAQWSPSLLALRIEPFIDRKHFVVWERAFEACYQNSSGREWTALEEVVKHLLDQESDAAIKAVLKVIAMIVKVPDVATA